MSEQPPAELDEQKRAANLAKHGVDFSDVAHFDWDTALVELDRDAVGEMRFIALGMIYGAVHVLVFTHAGDDVIRVISLRRAVPKEGRRFHE